MKPETAREHRVTAAKTLSFLEDCKLWWSKHFKTWFLEGYQAEFQIKSLYQVELIIRYKGKLW